MHNPDVINKLNARKQREHNELLKMAANYAAAEKSDPFALARAKAHINNGIASQRPHEKDSKPAVYDAEPYMETRLHPLTGEPYEVVAYKNVVRP